MEIRVLRYFLTVAREENITKAAELLHVSQPAVSRRFSISAPKFTTNNWF